MVTWDKYLEYRNGELIWKVAKGRRVKAGDVAGSMMKIGYIQVSVNGRRYFAHRIVWEMHNGKIPEGAEIDHINGIRHDNRIENLRVVSKVENCRNSALRSDNSSGYCGVTWDSSRMKWAAVIHVNGKNKNLGRFTNICDAVKARDEANKRYGFSDRHGKALEVTK